MRPMYWTRTKRLTISVSEILANHRRDAKSHWYSYLFLWGVPPAEMIENCTNDKDKEVIVMYLYVQ